MDIDEEKLEQIIEEMEPGIIIGITSKKYQQLHTQLKALIEPEKWEPKGGLFIIEPNGVIIEEEDQPYGCVVYGNAWETVKLAGIARDMNKRNQLILQAKHDPSVMAGDGKYTIIKEIDGHWFCSNYDCQENPEITFETYEQGNQVIEMLQLNANPS